MLASRERDLERFCAGARGIKGREVLGGVAVLVLLLCFSSTAALCCAAVVLKASTTAQ